MYLYNEHDKQLLQERVAQFQDQTTRFLDGRLSESEFLPLRLQNGLYIQRHAPMLRINIPYGMLSTTQLRRLADISDRFDKGYGHISTRQNIQLNWPKLEDVPAILGELAEVEMHAIQASGSCIRNITSDQFAGVATDEIEDPRPYCELIRQWSTFHPEFSFLPRKFKIAVNGAASDRAAVQFHDIGIELIKHEGQVACRIFVGGGLGRTPMVGEEIHPALPPQHLLTYLEAILRVYNLHGRRDNKYKARIKILVKATGLESFKRQVEHEWENYLKDGPSTLTDEDITWAKSFFGAPKYETQHDPSVVQQIESQRADHRAFDLWLQRNVKEHKHANYAIVNLSLKPTGVAPGDVTSAQMRAIADIADKYSFGEVRTTHEQNMVLADVQRSNLFTLWQSLKELGLATPNIGYITDLISCPGGDYCSLANAKSIPVATAIQQRFDDIDYLHDIGDVDLNISGCMNACGHHHIGHIGILGVDKKGEEFFQICLGGDSGKDAKVAKILGPSFKAEEIPEVIEQILNQYVATRIEGERFIETVNRTGTDPFKEAVYGKKAA
jgi:sulfite reductase (NADPH) hemoprotein beta-component